MVVPLGYHARLVDGVAMVRRFAGLFDLRELQERCAGLSSPLGLPPLAIGWTWSAVKLMGCFQCSV